MAPLIADEERPETKKRTAKEVTKSVLSAAKTNKAANRLGFKKTAKFV
jgi:hypothetical protein